MQRPRSKIHSQTQNAPFRWPYRALYIEVRETLTSKSEKKKQQTACVCVCVCVYKCQCAGHRRLRMAGKGGTAPATYSPSPTTQKKKAPLFQEDWVRPDGRGFHQCRPACNPISIFQYTFKFNSTLFSFYSLHNLNL